MGVNVLDQLPFIRKATLSVARDVTAAEADVIPEGFRNNIRWNLGHIVATTDRLAFGIAGLPSRAPDGYAKWFGRDSSPGTWEGDVPGLEEIIARLEEQPERIRESLEGRLDTPLDKPYPLPSGLTFHTIGEALNYSMYHEGVHLGTIKSYLRQIRKP